MDAATLQFIEKILRGFLFFVLYIAVGSGSGFILGTMAANRIIGKGKPLRMDSHFANITKAAEHNKQWHPEHEKWK